MKTERTLLDGYHFAGEYRSSVDCSCQVTRFLFVFSSVLFVFQSSVLSSSAIWVSGFDLPCLVRSCGSVDRPCFHLRSVGSSFIWSSDFLPKSGVATDSGGIVSMVENNGVQTVSKKFHRFLVAVVTVSVSMVSTDSILLSSSFHPGVLEAPPGNGETFVTEVEMEEGDGLCASENGTNHPRKMKLVGVAMLSSNSVNDLLENVSISASGQRG